MLYLLLKVAAAVSMGLILKRVDSAGLDRLPVIRINYVVAAILAFLAALFLGQSRISLPTAVLAGITGILFVVGMLVWAETIRVAGLALSVIAMRTAIVIPVAASVVVWREQPTVFQLAGIGAAVVALALVLTRPGRTQTGTAGRGQRGVGLWLAALFTADGLVMLAAKVFREHMPQSENLPFQSAVFLSASFITTGLYYLRKPRVTPAALRFGAVLGAANLGNHLFLILALSVLPGAAVYPVIAAAEVGVLALAGTLVWKERVGLRGWLGIALAVLALILIQLGGPAAV